VHFTLGESQKYTEKDIREAARAFTGWRVKFASGRAEFDFDQHDGGTKTVLGRTGSFDGIDVLDIVLRESRVSVHLAELLWKEFVAEEIDPAELGRLAAVLRKNDYHLRPMLKALFMSDGFRNPEKRKALIKSPVDLTIGTLRLFTLSDPDYRAVIVQQSMMGQSIFDPPDVKGWRGGKEWITSETLLRRESFLRALARGLVQDGSANNMTSGPESRPPFGLSDVSNFYDQEQRTPGYIQQVLLPIPPVGQSTTEKSRADLKTLLLNPAYQVK